jgi:hypothetical protein
MGGPGNRDERSIHDEPQPDNRWMYGLLLVRIHRPCPCSTTAVGPLGIGFTIRPRCEAWLLNAVCFSGTLRTLLLRGRVPVD